MSRDSSWLRWTTKAGDDLLACVLVTYMVTVVTPPLGACHCRVSTLHRSGHRIIRRCLIRLVHFYLNTPNKVLRHYDMQTSLASHPMHSFFSQLHTRRYQPDWWAHWSFWSGSPALWCSIHSSLLNQLNSDILLEAGGVWGEILGGSIFLWVHCLLDGPIRGLQSTPGCFKFNLWRLQHLKICFVIFDEKDSPFALQITHWLANFERHPIVGPSSDRSLLKREKATWVVLKNLKIAPESWVRRGLWIVLYLFHELERFNMLFLKK